MKRNTILLWAIGLVLAFAGCWPSKSNREACKNGDTIGDSYERGRTDDAILFCGLYATFAARGTQGTTDGALALCAFAALRLSECDKKSGGTDIEVVRP